MSETPDPCLKFSRHSWSFSTLNKKFLQKYVIPMLSCVIYLTIVKPIFLFNYFPWSSKNFWLGQWWWAGTKYFWLIYFHFHHSPPMSLPLSQINSSLSFPLLSFLIFLARFPIKPEGGEIHLHHQKILIASRSILSSLLPCGAADVGWKIVAKVGT